ncbi:MAG: hypothetical protein KAI81_01920, partial [Candidatus Marinimicrobia bacterium]|nr:hypothetical protein [Candidatus Neomarinimicrobiota bacterium]
MKKLGLSLILIFSFGLQSAWSWDHNYRHFESTHLHTNNNCYGYALARLNGKTEGEAYCAPERSYAMAISTNNLSTDFENLNIGDVLVWGYVQVKGTEAESGHAAYVISIPTPFVLNNVLVRQVPNNGGSPENKLVSQNTSYGDVLGYIHNPNGYSLRVTLANLFGNSEDANSRIEKYIYTSGSKGPGVYIPVLHGNDEYCSINNPEMIDIQAKETHDYSGKTYTFLNWKRNGMSISTK